MQVPELLPLHLAAWKALTAQLRGKLTTRTLHSELVFNISGNLHVRPPPLTMINIKHSALCAADL